MSLVIVTDVFCDECGNWETGTHGKRKDATKARKNVARKGWIQRGSFDYCPSCAEKIKKVNRA